MASASLRPSSVLILSLQPGLLLIQSPYLIKLVPVHRFTTPKMMSNKHLSGQDDGSFPKSGYGRNLLSYSGLRIRKFLRSWMTLKVEADAEIERRRIR